MKKLLVLVSLCAIAVVAQAADMYAVLDCIDQVTVVDTVSLKGPGRPEIPVFTAGFRGDPGEMDTVNMGAQRWPDEHIRVSYLYNVNRMTPFVISAPQQNTWYDLPSSDPHATDSRVMFYLGDGIAEPDTPTAIGPALAATPNPLIGRTVLRFELPRATRADVRIYDGTGRHVRTISGAQLAAGVHRFTWNRRDSDGRRVESGVYVARLSTPDGNTLIKLVVTD